MAKLKEAPEKPGNDVYTGLLALSLAAMVIGCVLLFLDLQTYEGRSPAPTPKLELPTQFKTTPAAATPRVEKKDEPAPMPMPMPMPEEKKEGARREPKGVPATPTSNPKPEKVEPKPVGMAEPAPLPRLTEERIDSKVVPAVALEPVNPAVKKTGDEPPVTTPAFRPN